MSILDRYIFGIVASAIFAVLLILLGIDSLAELISEMRETQADYGILQVLFYILLKLPGSLSEYAGYSALIGVLIGLGLLSNTGELTVIRASGFSLLRIGWMVIQPALLLIILASLLAEFIAPTLAQTAESQRAILRDDRNQGIEESGLWMFDRGTFLHVDAVYPNGRLLGLSRYRIDIDQARLEARMSEEADFDEAQSRWSEHRLRWTDVSPFQVSSGIDPEKNWVTELRPELLNMSVLGAEQMSVRDLSQYTDYLGEDQQRAREYKVQFWKKVLAPLSITSLVFVGMSFVLGSNRQVAVGERIFVGVIIGTVFQLLQDIFGPASVVWGFSAFLAVLIPILLTLAFGALLLRLRS